MTAASITDLFELNAHMTRSTKSQYKNYNSSVDGNDKNVERVMSEWKSLAFGGGDGCSLRVRYRHVQKSNDSSLINSNNSNEKYQVSATGSYLMIASDCDDGRVAVFGGKRVSSSKNNSSSSLLVDSSSNNDNNDDDFEKLYEDYESKKLLNLDPAKWLEQDHYAVLGLSSMRFRATDEDIKKAYRRKALKHHPDKGGSTDNFFKCVQKAYEFMCDPVKRKQFDSIDNKFDDSIPTGYSPTTHDFFKTFGPVFHRNAHFSKVQPVPELGGLDTPRPQVEHFYDFWAGFQSWRSFELKDEELPSENDSRDERRWIEKQNKAQRAKLQKEDRARLVKLVDLAIQFDPRLKQYKLDDRAAKEAKKNEKERVAKEAEEQVKRLKEMELAEQARVESERKAVADKEKSDQKQRKQLIKNERRDFRQTLSSPQCFGSGAQSGVPTVDEAEKYVSELLMAFGDDLDRLRAFHESLKACADPVATWSLFQSEYNALENRQHTIQQPVAKEPVSSASTAEKSAKKETPWNEDEIRLLIKAVNTFPGGVKNRWEKIAEYIFNHCPSKVELRRVEEIIQKSKEVKSKDYLKFASSLQSVERPKVVINEKPTEKVAEEGGVQESAVAQDSSEHQKDAATVRPWSADEQSLLEKALRSFPSSGPNAYKGADRWEKITEMVGTRPKKEVIQRVKEIIQSLQQQKK